MVQWPGSSVLERAWARREELPAGLQREVAVRLLERGGEIGAAPLLELLEGDDGSVSHRASWFHALAAHALTPAQQGQVAQMKTWSEDELAPATLLIAHGAALSGSDGGEALFEALESLMDLQWFAAVRDPRARLREAIAILSESAWQDRLMVRAMEVYDAAPEARDAAFEVLLDGVVAQEDTRCPHVVLLLAMAAQLELRPLCPVGFTEKLFLWEDASLLSELDEFRLEEAWREAYDSTYQETHEEAIAKWRAFGEALATEVRERLEGASIASEDRAALEALMAPIERVAQRFDERLSGVFSETSTVLWAGLASAWHIVFGQLHYFEDDFTERLSLGRMALRAMFAPPAMRERYDAHFVEEFEAYGRSDEEEDYEGVPVEGRFKKIFTDLFESDHVAVLEWIGRGGANLDAALLELVVRALREHFPSYMELMLKEHAFFSPSWLDAASAHHAEVLPLLEPALLEPTRSGATSLAMWMAWHHGDRGAVLQRLEPLLTQDMERWRLEELMLAPAPELLDGVLALWRPGQDELTRAAALLALLSERWEALPERVREEIEQLDVPRGGRRCTFNCPSCEAQFSQQILAVNISPGDEEGVVFTPLPYPRCAYCGEEGGDPTLLTAFSFQMTARGLLSDSQDEDTNASMLFWRPLPGILGVTHGAMAMRHLKLRTGTFIELRDALEAEVAVAPRDPGLLARLTKFYHNMCDIEAARQAVSRWLEVAPNDFEARCFASSIELRAGEDTRAVTLAVDALNTYLTHGSAAIDVEEAWRLVNEMFLFLLLPLSARRGLRMTLTPGAIPFYHEQNVPFPQQATLDLDDVSFPEAFAYLMTDYHIASKLELVPRPERVDAAMRKMFHESQWSLQQRPGETFVREEVKVGRNDPCPCGSGKKYKKCCMRS